MAAIILPHWWRRQPTVGQAAPNPALMLTSLVLPGQSRRDLVSGLMLNSTTGTPTRSVSELGPQLQTAGSNNSIFDNSVSSQRTSSASIVWVGNLITTATASASLCGLTFNSANTNPFVSFQIKRNQASTGNIYLNFSTSGSGDVRVESGGGYTSGPVAVVATCSPGRQRLFIRRLSSDSSRSLEQASGTVSGTLNYSTTSRLEIGDSLNARGPQAACALTALSSRAWSDVEAIAVVENPWSLFAPLTRKLYFGAPVSGLTLLPAGLVHSHVLSSSAIVLAQTLTAQTLAHVQALATASLNTGTTLNPAALLHAHVFGVPTLSATGSASLSPASLLHAHALSEAAVNTLTTIAAASLAHAHTLGAAALVGGGALIPAAMAHTQTLGEPALVLRSTIAPGALVHVHALGSVSVTVDGANAPFGVPSSLRVDVTLRPGSFSSSRPGNKQRSRR